MVQWPDSSLNQKVGGPLTCSMELITMAYHCKAKVWLFTGPCLLASVAFQSINFSHFPIVQSLQCFFVQRPYSTMPSSMSAGPGSINFIHVIQKNLDQLLVSSLARIDDGYLAGKETHKSMGERLMSSLSALQIQPESNLSGWI